MATHGAACRVRRVAVGLAAAAVTLVGAASTQPAQAATASPGPTPTTTTSTTRPDRVELRVDYGGSAPERDAGRDPAVVALVIAAGAHLVGIGAWATARVARGRREELTAWPVDARRHQGIS